MILPPNPHLDDDQNYVDEPDWSPMYLWDRLTHKYLGPGQDPTHRLAPKFFMDRGRLALSVSESCAAKILNS